MSIYEKQQEKFGQTCNWLECDFHHENWLRSPFQKQSYSNNVAEHYVGVEFKSISDNMKNIMSIARITDKFQNGIKISFEI